MPPLLLLLLLGRREPVYTIAVYALVACELLSYPPAPNALPSLVSSPRRHVRHSTTAAPVTPRPRSLVRLHHCHPSVRCTIPSSPIATSGSLERRPKTPHPPLSHPPASTCYPDTASTARAHSQAPPTEPSLTFALPLARHSRALPWTQTTPYRHPGMLHRTFASTLAMRTSSTSRTTHS